MPIKYWTLLLLMILPGLVLAQGTLSGKVVDSNGVEIYGARVFVSGTSIGTTTNSYGDYFIPNITPGTYQLKAKFIDHDEQTQLLVIKSGQGTIVNFTLPSFTIKAQAVELSGTYMEGTNIQTSSNITLLPNDKKGYFTYTQNLSSILQKLPGVYVDDSRGLTNNQVYSRGFYRASSSEYGPIGTGIRYHSLQEDGLPIMSVKLNFAQADNFFRPDLSISRLEATHGGKSTVTASDSPAGILNFINHVGGDSFEAQTAVRSGVNGPGNTFVRSDLKIGSAIAAGNWGYQLSGFYRYDEGARQSVEKAGKGGQVKLSIANSSDQFLWRFYGKYLNDQNALTSAIPYQNTQTPAPYENFNPNYHSAYPTWMNGTTINSMTTETGYNDGISNVAKVVGFEFGGQLGNGWEISNHFRAGIFEQDFQQFSNNSLVDLNDQHLSHSDLDQFQFYDATSGILLANADPTIASLQNELGSKVMLLKGRQSQATIDDYINKLAVKYKGRKHTLGFDLKYSRNQTDLNINGLQGLSSFKNEPIPLTLTHRNPYRGLELGTPDGTLVVINQPLLNISSPQGVMSLGSGLANQMQIESQSFSGMINETWAASSQLFLDLGFRYEVLRQNGYKWGNQIIGGQNGFGGIYDRDSQQGLVSVLALGNDQNPFTFFDTNERGIIGTKYDFNFQYNYWSASLGVNYQLSDLNAIYLRASKGNKAPDFDHYVYYNQNTEIGAAALEENYQIELGLKLASTSVKSQITGYWSKAGNIAHSDFIFKSAELQYITPLTYNESETLGLELETNWQPSALLHIDLVVSAQNPLWNSFSYYDPVLLSNQSFPNESDFALALKEISGNRLPNIPQFYGQLGVTLNTDRFITSIFGQYTSQRYFNNVNTISTEGFYILNAHFELPLSESFSLLFQGTNLLNSYGIQSLNGFGHLGESLESLTSEELSVRNRNSSPFFARPVQSRLISGGFVFTIR